MWVSSKKNTANIGIRSRFLAWRAVRLTTLAAPKATTPTPRGTGRSINREVTAKWAKTRPNTATGFTQPLSCPRRRSRNAVPNHWAKKRALKASGTIRALSSR